MKKALIILIVLAVIVCSVFTVVYFVWTPQNMKSWGDDALADGRIDRAVSWYERAVSAEPTNAEYVLALVDANILAQNFTQAERNLISAIKAAPSAALYAKLSYVYVLQDKLYDAQMMLDSIADPTINAEINAMRPSALVVSPEGGVEYHELISVEITSNHQVYYSLSDTFPSTATSPYSQPISMAPGTTRLQAIAVSESGLVSPLFDTSYLLVGVVQEISFASKELEDMVRQMLYIPSVEPVMSDDLWEITELEIPSHVANYSDLQYFENLKTLTIHGSVVEDYAFLSHLNELEILDVSGSYISDETMNYIGKLSSLMHLNLSKCGRSDISALSSATSLVSLDLSFNSIQQISALESLEKLEILNLESNAITLIDSLGRMSALTELNIARNNLSSLDPLANSIGLVKLIADNNQLMDISVLQSMPILEYLTASNNRIADAGYLSVCTQMTHLDLSNNRLSAIDAIVNMPLLSYLNVSENSITALPELGVMSELQQFIAANNLLSSIEALANQPTLTYVNVDYNPELEDITCLTSCPMLVKVDAFGTKVHDIQALLDMSVIVNYDPSAIIDNQNNDD